MKRLSCSEAGVGIVARSLMGAYLELAVRSFPAGLGALGDLNVSSLRPSPRLYYVSQCRIKGMFYASSYHIEVVYVLNLDAYEAFKQLRRPRPGLTSTASTGT